MDLAANLADVGDRPARRLDRRDHGRPSGRADKLDPRRRRPRHVDVARSTGRPRPPRRECRRRQHRVPRSAVPPPLPQWRPRHAAGRAGRARRPSEARRERHGPRAPSDSSPISATRPGPARTCSEPSRIPTAIARSSEAPAFRRSAGARLTVIRRGGWTNPALRSAPRTRSRASWSAASASPTIVNPGSPGATSTSTRISRPSRPWSVADGTMANTRAAYGRTLTRQSTVAHPSLIRRVPEAPRASPSYLVRALSCRVAVTGATSAAGLSMLFANCTSDVPSAELDFENTNGEPVVEGADRAPVLIHDLVLDDPPQRTLGILHADAGECVRTVQDELDLVAGNRGGPSSRGSPERS